MKKPTTQETDLEYSLKEFCSILSISMATGRNWIKLGKLHPDRERLGKPYFSAAYTSKIQKKLQKEDTGSLKSRRNKKYIRGNTIYRNYIPKDSQNFETIQEMIKQLEDSFLADSQIRAILAECAIQLLCQAYERNTAFTENFLLHYSMGEIPLGQYDTLIQELLSDETSTSYSKELCMTVQKNIPQAFQVSFLLEKNVDILGLLYISLKNLGERKAAGSYYTPTYTVHKLIQSLLPQEVKLQTRILDPCCGTGNFLLQLPNYFTMEQIFGRDIDRISILAARINMALKFKDTPVSMIKEHITIQDFLLEEQNSYDFILGNPPWGSQFSKDVRASLKEKFETAKGSHVESYLVFVEQALNAVSYGGKIAFVLPEALLHVKSHLAIRKIILHQAQIEHLEYLGNVFDKVQCPAVLLQIRKTKKPFHTRGIEISYHGKMFTIQTDRQIDPEHFNFHISDEEYELIEKIQHQEHMIFLKNQAEFALGIVTGNNKRWVQKEQTTKNEIVLKGTDIHKYKITPKETYLIYAPEKFQQSAKEEYYRAEEKLLYRFIGNQLIFAYDNQQRLSLNSCNILIPHVPHMDIKYIMAILNSTVVQFIYSRKFHSMKILRTYLEQLPLPFPSEKQQQEIISLEEKIMIEKDEKKWLAYYEKADKLIACVYGLSEQEYENIHKAENIRP